MIWVREKAYSDYSGLLGYDTISMGVVSHVLPLQRSRHSRHWTSVPLMTEALEFFKTSRTTDPVTQHYIPEHLILRNNAVKTENTQYY
jgi:hypothetical protein